MNVKSSFLCKVGFSWGPNGYPAFGLELGWVIEIGHRLGYICSNPKAFLPFSVQKAETGAFSFFNAHFSRCLLCAASFLMP
jgi:hypothetical protein